MAMKTNMQVTGYGPQPGKTQALVIVTVVLDFERIEAVSDEMRALIEELWPELVHKLPPKEGH